jgi:hypothetical protein
MDQDADLEGMDPDRLLVEVKRLRAAIREHRDSSGMELCWHHPKLWNLLPEKVEPEIAIPEWPQFLRGCVRYRQALDEEQPTAPRTSEEYNAQSD